MKVRWPTIARWAYWKARAAALQIEPWEALTHEIPVGARIAIVGNAGYLLESGYGRQIDACDVVIRMNNFRLSGYDHAIGTHVDIVLTNFSRYTMAFDNPDLQRARLFVSSRPMNFVRHPRVGVHDRLGQHVTAGMCALGAKRVFVPDFSYFVAQSNRLGMYPTTGMMALQLVVDVLAGRCGELFLTGFSFFQGRNHYFSENTVDATRFHNVDAERRAFKEVVTQHRDWIHTDPIMWACMEGKGVTERAEVNVASARRSA